MNGVAVSSFPVTLQTGNTLAITTTSSSSNDTATFVTVTFGGQQYIVTFVTESPYSNIFDADMYAVPFYQRTFSDGSLYNSPTHTYSVADHGAITEMQTTATPSGINDTTYQVMVLDPYNDAAHLVGSDGVLVATYNVPDAIWTGATVYNVGKFTFWFGLFHEDQVGITLDGETFTYLTFQNSPVAIASTMAANYVWVACYDGSIFCYQNVGPLTFNLVSQVKLSTVPTSMVVDDSYNVYVVSMDDTIVSKFNTAGALLGTAPVGNMPIGIALASSQLFISCAEDQTVNVFNSSTLAQTGQISLTEFPGLITIDPTAPTLCVTCLSSSNVYRFKTDSSLAQIDMTTFSKPVLAAYSFGTTIIADHLQYDARPYTRSFTSIVPGLGFFENDQEPIFTAVNSTTVTATEIEVAVPINIPTNLGASIILNGANIGTSGVVNVNDQFYITFVTPSTQQTFTQIPVSVGNYVEAWNTTTAAILTAPNPFYFAPVSASPNQAVQTQVVTIGGLTPGTSVTVSTSIGAILKNGVAQTGSFTVTNGDTIQLQVAASATKGNSVLTTVTAGSFSTNWVVYTQAILHTFTQTLTSQALSTAVSSTSVWTYNNTVTDPDTHIVSPTSTTLLFPAGVSVTVNGAAVSSGVTIHTSDVVAISGTTAAQYDQTSTFAATTLDGYVFQLIATTVLNAVPYPMDFGVIYDVAPGSYYESLDVTVQNIQTSAQLSLQNPGSFLINDGDTGVEQITVANGTLLGLSVRGQASAHNLMYTIPVYALANDGVTLVVCGSVRIVPMILKGSIDYPYEGHEDNNLMKYFRYKEGVYESLLPTPAVGNNTCVEPNNTYGWIYELGIEVESGYEYTTDYQFGNAFESGYAYTTTPMMSATEESSYVHDWAAYIAAYEETQYTFTVYDGTSPYHESQFAPGWYFYKTGNLWEVQPATILMVYPTFHMTTAISPNAMNPNYGNSWEVRPKYVNNKTYQFFEVPMKFVNNKIYQFIQIPIKLIGNINNTVGTWNTSAGSILPGYWMSNMPMPEMIDHVKLLTPMPTGFMPAGCQHGLPDMPSAIYEIAEMVEADMPQPNLPIDTIYVADGRNAVYVDAVSHEFDGLATQVTIVAEYEVDLPQPQMYSEQMNPSVSDPTLFGGFADQASAQQFITDNNLVNAHLYQLSNGTWMIITDVTQDLACAIVPETGLRAIGWLLQGG